MTAATDWHSAWGGLVGLLLAGATGYWLAVHLVAARCASTAEVVRLRCWP